MLDGGAERQCAVMDKEKQMSNWPDNQEQEVFGGEIDLGVKKE